MKRTSIATKIILLSCGIALLLMVMGCFLIAQYQVKLLSHVAESQIDVKENRFMSRFYTEKEEMRDQLDKLINHVSKLMNSVDVIYEQTFQFQVQNLLMHPMIIAVEFCDKDGRPFISSWKSKGEIKIGAQTPDEINLSQFPFIKKHTNIPAIEIIQVFYTTKPLEEKLFFLKNVEIVDIRQTQISIYSKLRNLFLTQSLGSCLIVFLLGLSLILSLRRTVLNPIQELMIISRQLKDQDLSVDIRSKSYSHELELLVEALAQLLDGFRQIIADVKENAYLLSNSADSITDIAEELTTHSEEAESKSNNVAEASVQISANIHSIANSVEQISDNIETVSSTSDYLFNNINSVANSIEELSSSLTHVGERAQNGTKIAEQAVLLAQKAGKTVNSLRHAADEIGGVSEFIQRIAHKTNILSLNATIEAASAGSAGRGFSVVAAAIQEFAEQSSRAAKDITDRIVGVQKGTSEIEAAFNDVSTIIRQMNESSESISFAVIEQTKAVQEIANNALEADERARNINISIDELSRTANDAADNTAQVALGANDVSTRIQGVSESISFNRQISHQINETAIVLNHLSGNLKFMIDPFKVKPSTNITENKSTSEEKQI